MNITPVTCSGVYPQTGHKWKLFHLLISGTKEELSTYLNTFPHPPSVMIECDTARNELVLHCPSKHRMKVLQKEIEMHMTMLDK